MKALSLWQPHAAAIALELKPYETRDWPTSYRGPLAIHAAKREWNDIDDWHAEASARLMARCSDLIEHLCPKIELEHGRRARNYLHERVLVFGAVVCVADLVDCVPTRELRGNIPPAHEFWGDFRDGETGKGRYAFKLENVRTLPQPIAWRGMQGFFEVELAGVIDSRLTAAAAVPGAAALPDVRPDLFGQLDLFGGAL
jgi:hypothetical protein